MTNNDILRRVRYLFDLNDAKMIELFKLVNQDVSRAVLCDWLKREDDPSLIEITDKELSNFLNGLIIEKRGKREGPIPVAEDPLTNNMILKKLKITLNLKSDDILDMLAAIDKPISKHELSAFFRNPDHKSYRDFLDQYLRYFLNALQKHYKPNLSNYDIRQ